MKLWKKHRLQELADGQASTGGGGDSSASTSIDSASGSTTNVSAGDTAQATQTQASDSGAQQQSPTDKAADAGATDGTATAKVVPETYEFKAPDGVTFDAEVIGELSGIAKEAGLTQEQASKFADLGVKLTQKLQTQQVEALVKMDQEWIAETTADAEIGGTKLEESRALSKKAIDEIGTPKLAELLEKSRLGNHPEVIRILAKVGRMVSQDNKLVTGMAPTKSFATTAQRMYPNMNP